MKLTVEKLLFPLKAPFVITGHIFSSCPAVHVTLEDDGVKGHGEGIGVYYTGDSVDIMLEQLEQVRPEIEKGIDRYALQELLPPGGARNALDCAFWDLDAKKKGKTVWQLLDLTPHSLTTVCTVGINTPANMAAHAAALAGYSHLKIKLNGDEPIKCLEAIRGVRPDANIIIDVNQGWSFDELKDYIPHCKKLSIDMIEQPLPRGADEELEGFVSPVPLGGDESCLTLKEYAAAKKRYDVINIKLDKCGGLTEGLKIVLQAKHDGKRLMVGNMVGSSMSMAPAYVIGQFCQYVDIDGPLLLQKDLDECLGYGEGGVVGLPTPALWG